MRRFNVYKGDDLIGMAVLFSNGDIAIHYLLPNTVSVLHTGVAHHFTNRGMRVEWVDKE